MMVVPIEGVRQTMPSLATGGATKCKNVTATDLDYGDLTLTEVPSETLFEEPLLYQPYWVGEAHGEG